jgi:predicted ribosome quality control (RQC) complex YloA/Tae2 family protein
MSLTATEISRILGEIGPLMRDRPLTRVAMPNPETVVLYLDADDRYLRLLLSVADDLSRIHLEPQPVRSIKPPLPFGATLENALAGAKLANIEQPEGDRALRLVFQPVDNTSGFELVAELTGRHANVFLLDEKDVIRATMRPNRSNKRELAVGRPYEPMLSRPGHTEDRPARPSIPEGFEPECTSFNERVAHWYTDQEKNRDFYQLYTDTHRKLKAGLKRQVRTLAKLDGELQRSENAQTYRKQGDLLKSHLHQLGRGMGSATVTDWETGEPTTIELDPALTPQENMKALYHKAAKGERGAERVLARIDEIEAKRDQLQRRLDKLEPLEKTVNLDGLRELRHRWKMPESLIQQRKEKKKKESSRNPHYREFHAKTGDRILVGRSAKDNDRLTLGIAKGWDFWLHAHHQAGSHVVIPMRKDGELGQETLLDAATLAVHYSKARTGQEAEVLYTRAKFVRKGKKDPPGRVSVASFKTMHVVVDKERITRLMAADKDKG